MSKVTSKLQVTVPKVIADEYGIRAGNDLQWVAAGEAIRLIPENSRGAAHETLDLKARLDLFDKATQRQKRRETALKRKTSPPSSVTDRGWRREDLYHRGRTD